jgi:hypothetical protein
MKVMEELRAEHQQQLDRERKAYLELKQASSSQRQAQIRIPALNLRLSRLWERCLREARCLRCAAGPGPSTAEVDGAPEGDGGRGGR